eukprot:TRINITY_DN95394_c0_g1_i1.p1 TRINITY_DN95394_c0_g1~~TRINITY_DN95394_c0_g1_i1.p1  ORF type:complete len:482 (-),score=69.28 TRINITY_DN95394_c0_g1_i1:48-1493(-)
MERGLLSRILYPAPTPTYTADSFPQELIWVPKKCSLDGDPPAVGVESVPCLLLRYPFSRFLFLFFHSNAEDLGRCRAFCSTLRDKFQVHVLAVEYPGYGICPGVPNGTSVMENALSAMHFATQTLQWPVDSIKVFGRSIGTGPAVKLASLFRFAGVVLVTPFLSIRELFRDRVGRMADLVEEWYPNFELVRDIKSPTLVIHGKKDEMIGSRHGETLFSLLGSRKLFVSPDDMYHNTNLLNDAHYLIVPATQFFSLPDYVFHELDVPDWAFDRERCPPSSRPWSWGRLGRPPPEAPEGDGSGDSAENSDNVKKLVAMANKLFSLESPLDVFCSTGVGGREATGSRLATIRQGLGLCAASPPGLQGEVVDVHESPDSQVGNTLDQPRRGLNPRFARPLLDDDQEVTPPKALAPPASLRYGLACCSMDRQPEGDVLAAGWQPPPQDGEEEELVSKISFQKFDRSASDGSAQQVPAPFATFQVSI